MPSLRLLFLLSLSLGACTTATFNEQNYSQCLPFLESDRQQARAQKDFSYEPVNFSYCRAPARYRNELQGE